MKILILLGFMLGSLGASAQNVPRKVPQGALEPDGNTHHEPALYAGYWTLLTEDPLIVRQDPIISDPIYTATAIANPSTASLTVDFGDEIPDERVTVAVSDTVGYKLLTSTSFLPKHKEHIVSFNSLKSGAYRVVVYRDDKRVLYMGDFQKN